VSNRSRLTRFAASHAMSITLFTDKRAAWLVRLASMAVLAVVGFWYPMLVARQNAGPDDRFGFALIVAVPFVLVGGCLAVWSFWRLLRLIKADARGATALLLFGALLMFVSVIPALWALHILFIFVS
jgi:hypothetical protein